MPMTFADSPDIIWADTADAVWDKVAGEYRYIFSVWPFSVAISTITPNIAVKGLTPDAILTGVKPSASMSNVNSVTR